MGPEQASSTARVHQGATGKRRKSCWRRARRCLLKGCKKRFVARAQYGLRAKFCSDDCRKQAKKWRNWLWRHTPNGKQATRRGNRRFRKAAPDYHRNYRKRHLERIRAIERASKRRSRTKASTDVHKVGPSLVLPCRRPGCYSLFILLEALSGVRRYCGRVCRRVMRRFLALLAQLRYRKTPSGNYKRKLSRPTAQAPVKSSHPP